MMRHTVQDTGLWEVWIEFNESGDSHFGTLYIIGEFNAGGQKARFIRLPCEENTHILKLQIPVQPHHSTGPTREYLYSEPVESIDTYDAVYIYAGDELVASFDEIEIMI